MSDQEWDVLEFVERFRNGEFDGRLGGVLDSLSPEQIEDLQSVVLMQGESRNDLQSGLHPTGKR
jgi:hypothetical protein